MRRTSYLQDYESSRSKSPKAASPADASRPPSRKAAEWSASRLEDACRAIEVMGARLEEVERHNLSLNENVKNCAHLIQLTQSFAEEQGREHAREVERLEGRLAAAAEGAARQEAALDTAAAKAAAAADAAAAAEASASAAAAAAPSSDAAGGGAAELGARMDQLQEQMKEMVSLKLSDAQERETELSGFQSEILRQNSQFESAMSAMTKRHAEVLYAKLDEDARGLVAERVQEEVSKIMTKVDGLAESSMAELRDKHTELQKQLESMTARQERAMTEKVETMESDVDARVGRLEKELTRRLGAVELGGEEREALLSSLRKQLQGNDEALGSSVDMLQVRYEGAAAELERLSAALRELRTETATQCAAATAACEKTNAECSRAIEQTTLASEAAADKMSRAIATNREELESWVSEQLENGVASVAEKEAVRFQALCRSVDERMLSAQQEISALGQGGVSSLQQVRPHDLSMMAVWDVFCC